MKYFLNRPELAEIPFILEVPGLDKEGPDAENIQRLKKLVDKK
jgi:endonuclease IV